MIAVRGRTKMYSEGRRDNTIEGSFMKICEGR